MQAALVKDGLFPDEAQAMLATWDQAYFKSPGLRLFYLVPQVWTDHILRLNVSMPAEIRRVMVGRIELVTPQQREILAELDSMSLKTDQDIVAARTQLQSLGRFGNALMLDHAAHHSGGQMSRNIEKLGLSALEVARPSSE
jgi:hypothetical protein